MHLALSIALCAALLFLPGPSAAQNDTAALLAILNGLSFKSDKQAEFYTKSWTGEVCQRKSIEGSPWNGIMCEGGGRVTFVHLKGAASGTLDGFGQLTALEQLTLANNSFTGTLPGAAWRNLTRLTWLNVRENALTGTLPPELAASSPKLQTLFVGGNRFTGTIPANMNLTFLDAASNRFSGTLPAALPPALQWLDFSNNSLTGSLPAAWAAHTNLTTIDLSRNKLAGPLPADWAALPDVQVILLSQNQLNGTVPAAWMAMKNIQYLGIQNNSLTGTLPAIKAGSSALVSVRLGYNELTGSLPPSWAQMTNLSILSLPRNQLNGSLPDAWGANNSFPSLAFLSMDDNALTGSIPTSWMTGQGCLKSLRGISLVLDKLNGTLPQPACPNNTFCRPDPARIVLAPQRKGYGVCGAAPPQLYVTTVQDLNITSIADAGAVALNSSVADVPCPGLPSQAERGVRPRKH